MAEKFYIPRYGKTGTAFLGVEFKNTWIFVVCVLVGFVLAARDNVQAGLAISTAGYFINKAVMEWKRGQLGNFMRTALYTLGLGGYSPALNKRNKTFVGDNTVIFLGARKAAERERAIQED